MHSRLVELVTFNVRMQEPCVGVCVHKLAGDHMPHSLEVLLSGCEAMQADTSVAFCVDSVCLVRNEANRSASCLSGLSSTLCLLSVCVCNQSVMWLGVCVCPGFNSAVMQPALMLYQTPMRVSPCLNPCLSLKRDNLVDDSVYLICL